MYIDHEDNDFEWDERKDRANFKKHGVRFDDAKRIFRKWMITRLDKRQAYGEQRYVSVGDAGGDTFLAVTYTHRSDKVRLISARKVNQYERAIYEAFIKETNQGDRCH